MSHEVGRRSQKGIPFSPVQGQLAKKHRTHHRSRRVGRILHRKAQLPIPKTAILMLFITYHLLYQLSRGYKFNSCDLFIVIVVIHFYIKSFSFDYNRLIFYKSEWNCNTVYDVFFVKEYVVDHTLPTSTQRSWFGSHSNDPVAP